MNYIDDLGIAEGQYVEAVTVFWFDMDDQAHRVSGIVINPRVGMQGHGVSDRGHEEPALYGLTVADDGCYEPYNSLVHVSCEDGRYYALWPEDIQS